MSVAYFIALLLVASAVACSGSPLVREARPAPTTAPTIAKAPRAEAALERDAEVHGRSIRYGVHLAALPNLVYQLDCVSGVAICAQPIYREHWAALGFDAQDEAALATWKELRSRHAGEIRRADGLRPPQPILAPSGVFAIPERQRIAGLLARTPAAYEASIALLSTDTDARALRDIIARFEPRFDAWWRQRGFAAGSASVDSFARLLAEPFLSSTIEKAARFYEADLPPDTALQIHVMVQPRTPRRFQVAFQLEGYAAVEAPEGGAPEGVIDVVAHELFHYFFFLMKPERQAALLGRVCASEDPFAVASFGVLDESVAATLGNGVIGRHYRTPDDFAKQLKHGLVNYQAAALVARALLPAMEPLLDQGTTISSDDFLRVFSDAARASYEGGRPRPIDYLHSHVSVADPRFSSAAQRLRDASGAWFPYLREYASSDRESTAFLAAHPFMSSALFLPRETEATAFLAALAADAKHRVALSSAAKRSRGFVYSLPRSAKSYAFLFVAADGPTMDALVERFVALPRSAEGALIELPI